MANLRFPNGELDEERKTLILEAGQTHGIDVRTNDRGDLQINSLTNQQFAQIVYETERQWGIPYNSVKCIPVAEE